jgi:O-methyltransferase
MNLVKFLFSFLKFEQDKNSSNVAIIDKFELIYKKYSDYTMISKNIYIDNLKLIEVHFKFFNLNQSIIECGVWRGGMIAGIADILGPEYCYHIFDSFEGLPDAKEIDGESAIKWQLDKESINYHNNCSAEQELVESVIKMSLAKKYYFYKGWFETTLPLNKNNIGQISLLRLDGDWYESTMTCLENLYPLIQYNGIIIVDDYFDWDGCCKAIHDYLSKIKSKSRIRTNGNLMYIIKID